MYKDIKDLKIEAVRIYKLNGTGTLKGFCDVSIAGAFVVKGFRIVESKDGLFVSAPSESGGDGRRYSVFISTTSEARDEIERVVLEAYENEEK